MRRSSAPTSRIITIESGLKARLSESQSVARQRRGDSNVDGARSTAASIIVAIMISVDWPFRAGQGRREGRQSQEGKKFAARSASHQRRQPSRGDREGADGEHTPQNLGSRQGESGERREQDRGRGKIQESVPGGVVDVASGKPLVRRVTISPDHRVIGTEDDEEADREDEHSPAEPRQLLRRQGCARTSARRRTA